MKTSANGEATPTIEEGTYEGFRYEIIDPSSTTTSVRIYIPPGESMKATPGCMFAMSSNIELKGKYKSSLKAHLFEPGSARFTVFTATDDKEGWVVLCPSFLGSVKVIEVTEGEDICVGDDAYLGAIGNIETSAKSQGLKKSMFSGHGTFVKKVKGNGIIFVCAVGSMMNFELGDDEDIVVDSGHVVTWPTSIKYTVKKASESWFSTGLSGEGMVLTFKGPGTISVQTRNAKDIAEWSYDAKAP